MADNSSNNKRIAKNTVLLYIRSIIVMLVSLYTSRVILHALGIEDYGLYNVIGGVVALFSFLRTSMQSASRQQLLTSAHTQSDQPDENPTIGLLICSDMDKAEVQWSFQGIQSPIGVATYNGIKVSDVLPSEELLRNRVRQLENELRLSRKLIHKLTEDTNE